MGGEGRMIPAGISLLGTLSEETLNERAAKLLHPAELGDAGAYRSLIRRQSYLHGRIAAKSAISKVFPGIDPVSLQIINGSFGEPILKNLSEPYGISIAHGEDWNAGLCFPLAMPMGIDAETVSEKNNSIIPAVLSAREKAVCGHEPDPLLFMHILWTLKEAAGKAIGLGFRVPHEWYETEAVEAEMHEGKIMYHCSFKHLNLFAGLSVSIPGGLISLVFPAGKGIDSLIYSLLHDTKIKVDGTGS
ncbi:MAG: 4'-phosphopantetheinyl transferase superfamily protein [Bacteroidota bacterium]